MYYKYVENGKLNKLDPTEMPLFDGLNRSANVTFYNIASDNYYIWRNIQVTNYKVAFRAATMTGFVANNILIKDMGALNSSNGYGFKMESSSSESNLIRIKNSIIINATHTGVKISGSHGLVENTKVYCNEALGVYDIDAPTDYYYLIGGSDNIIRNSIAFKDTPNSWGHNGHGFSLKTQANVAPVQYNLIEFCTAINIYGSFQARHINCKYNVFKDSEAHAKIPNRKISKTDQKTGGIQFISGGSYNVFERLYIHDVDVAISWIANGEHDTDVNIQQNSIIRNCVFDNINVAIRAYHAKTGGTSKPSGNKVYNCTFNNIDAMYRMVNDKPFQFAGNEFKNVIFNDIPIRDADLAFKGGWTYENSNFHNTWAVEKGSGNVSLPPGFENQSKGDFRLKSNSSMRDRGVKLDDVTSDFEKKHRSRSKEKPHDIGAYEYEEYKLSSKKANAGEDRTICFGEEIILTASDGSDYLWSTGETTKSIKVAPLETVTYSVKITEGNTSDSDEVRVIVNKVLANAGEDVSITEGNPVTLTASGGTEYLWNNGETGSSITVNPNSTITYEVRVTNEGCEAFDDVTVQVNKKNPSLISANAGEDRTICFGEETKLIASGGTSYLWSTGETTKSIKVSPKESVIYSVKVRDGKFSDSDEVRVIVNKVLANAGEDVSIREGNPVTLTASGGTEYLWSNGESGSSITVSPISTITYEVRVTNKGCEVFDDVTVKVNKESNAAVSAFAGEDQTICYGDEINLTASGGTNYLWSTGETTKSIKVSPVERTDYTVSVSDGNTTGFDEVTIDIKNCINEVSDIFDNQQIEVFPNPTTGILNLQSNGTHSEVDVHLINVNGKILYQERLNVEASGFSKQIDLSNYTKGIYFVRFINSDDFIDVKKIVII